MSPTPSLFSGEGVVIRVGELYLKGGNRHLFINALLANLKRAFKDRSDISFQKGHGRIFICGGADEDVISRLRFVFGISSYSPVTFCKKEMNAINETAVELARAALKPNTKTFRIAARRSDKQFSLNSAEIGRNTGSAVNVATGLGVDLERPDLSIGVEIGKQWTFLFTRQIPGGGGLPVGTSGRAALLLSGGIDSPVAGHLLQKRGVAITAVYFHAFPYTSDGAKKKVIDLARILAARQKRLRLYVVNFAKVQETLREAGASTYLVLLYRRAMMRIAGQLAQNDNIPVLATGENLGQVASQTIENIGVVEDAAPLPILRPILTMDKQETITIARDIGSYEISITPFEDCCTLFVPKHPETGGTIKAANRYEKRVDWQTPLARAIEEVEIIDL